MAGLTDVYRIVVVDGDGNHNALVFKEPEDRKVYLEGEVLKIDRTYGVTSYIANDAGELPHREPADYGPEGGGLTWHWAK